MAAFELSPDAEADLEGIFDYTARRWGVEQGNRYLHQLNECAKKIAVGKGRYKDYSYIRPGLRSIRCQQHFLFFVRLENMTARIVAVLHERMDLVARIAERLG
jgi:toxin ParE1/3/4